MSSSEGRRGFTLIEVIAAVAVLAIVFTALARSAMQGLANEGEATRRLRASLIADEQLDQIEAQLATQVPPAGTPQETELEDYTVVVDVRPFDLTGPALDAALKAATAHGRLQPEEKVGPDTTPPYALLTTDPSSRTPTLVEIVVQVRWMEGYDEQQVTRTTYAADPSVVEAAVGAAGGNAGGDTGGDGGGGAGQKPGAASGQGSGQGMGSGSKGTGSKSNRPGKQKSSFEEGR